MVFCGLRFGEAPGGGEVINIFIRRGCFAPFLSHRALTAGHFSGVGCQIGVSCQCWFPGIFRAGGILYSRKSLSCMFLFNFRATFALVNNRISVRSEACNDWKSTVRVRCYSNHFRYYLYVLECAFLQRFSRDIGLREKFYSWVKIYFLMATPHPLTKESQVPPGVKLPFNESLVSSSKLLNGHRIHCLAFALTIWGWSRSFCLLLKIENILKLSQMFRCKSL